MKIFFLFVFVLLNIQLNLLAFECTQNEAQVILKPSKVDQLNDHQCLASFSSEGIEYWNDSILCPIIWENAVKKEILINNCKNANSVNQISGILIDNDGEYLFIE